MAIELRLYQTAAGEQPLVEWLQGLKERPARTRIEARIARVAVGNFGDTGPVGEGVLELGIDWGPGYRVYFARLGQVVVLLLLCGGDQRTQQKGHRLCESVRRGLQGARDAEKATWPSLAGLMRPGSSSNSRIRPKPRRTSRP